MARASMPWRGWLPGTSACSRPELGLVHVGCEEFPVFRRIIEPVHKSILLLLARHVQKELKDDGPLSGEIILEMRDVGESLVPDVLSRERRR